MGVQLAFSEGTVLIGYALTRDEIMRDEVSTTCKCEGNSTIHKFCPVCGTMNSTCALADGFAIWYGPYDRKQPITRTFEFHDKPVAVTHDGHLIVTLRSEDVPPFASECSFTNRYNRGWKQMSLTGLESLREELQSQLSDIGVEWNEERFGVYVVRPRSGSASMFPSGSLPSGFWQTKQYT